jgi:hypothetical protein
MSNFTLKELNFTRIRQWIIEAKNKQETDPVYSFIAIWIGFNHFYATFADTNYKDFSEWTKKNMKGSQGDKAQLKYLIQKKEFVEFFDTFKFEQPTLLNLEITLPIINFLNKQCVPDGMKGKYKLSHLHINQLFEVIYQIRNNLFHGNKDPFRNIRDKELSQFGSEFMLLFISSLLSHTYGEEEDVFDIQQQAEIELVKGIAKTSTKD